MIAGGAGKNLCKNNVQILNTELYFCEYGFLSEK